MHRDKQGVDVNKLVGARQEAWLLTVVNRPADSNIQRIVVLGDSLSDTNNLRSKTFQFTLPPQLYWKGRFSNGPIWVDYVKSTLKISVKNYAVGGAETGQISGLKSLFIDSLKEQAQKYLQESTSAERRHDLLVIWIGPNNYFVKNNDNPKNVVDDIGRVARQTLSYKIQRLVLGTMPELAFLPVPPGHKKARPDSEFVQITKKHNTRIKQLVKYLAERFPDRAVLTFDAHSIYSKTTSYPKDYGFANLKRACYPGDVFGSFYQGNSLCKKFLSTRHWDYVHPNTMMHCYYAAQFLHDIKSLLHGFRFEYTSLIDRCHQLMKREL